MTQEANIDFGSIQIHKKAIADIARSSLQELDGVSLPAPGIGHQLLELLGTRTYPGIKVLIDKDNQISIEIKIIVRFGVNIPDVARQVQDIIRTNVERIADIDLKDIHVNIHGIERGKS